MSNCLKFFANPMHITTTPHTNPNKRFVLLSEALASNQPITKNGKAIMESGVDLEGSEEVIEDEILVHNSESEEEFEAPVQRTRLVGLLKNHAICR
jgi:hypothetical protein